MGNTNLKASDLDPDNFQGKVNYHIASKVEAITLFLANKSKNHKRGNQVQRTPQLEQAVNLIVVFVRSRLQVELRVPQLHRQGRLRKGLAC